ncbi:MAG: response regulator [Roseiflexaceae bacterium]|nr:response regulator [Roseiflexaceae bacterium]
MPEQPLSILVVDDEPAICWLFESVLRPLGYAVTTTGLGLEALRLWHETHHALVFVDSLLPDARGIDVAAQIRQRRPETAIVLISGSRHGEDELAAAGLQEGRLTIFLPKPFNLREMRAIAGQTAARNTNHSMVHLI